MGYPGYRRSHLIPALTVLRSIPSRRTRHRPLIHPLLPVSLSPNSSTPAAVCDILQRGVVIGAGEPKSLNYRALIDAASAAASAAASSSASGIMSENDVPQVHNTAATAAAAPAVGLVFDDDF